MATRSEIYVYSDLSTRCANGLPLSILYDTEHHDRPNNRERGGETVRRTCQHPLISAGGQMIHCCLGEALRISRMTNRVRSVRIKRFAVGYLQLSDQSLGRFAIDRHLSFARDRVSASFVDDRSTPIVSETGSVGWSHVEEFCWSQSFPRMAMRVDGLTDRGLLSILRFDCFA